MKERNHNQGVQPEMEIVMPTHSAEESNARLDRIFERLYRLRGNKLKGLSAELEDEPSEQRVERDHDFLFHLPAMRSWKQDA